MRMWIDLDVDSEEEGSRRRFTTRGVPAVQRKSRVITEEEPGAASLMRDGQPLAAIFRWMATEPYATCSAMWCNSSARSGSGRWWGSSP